MSNVLLRAERTKWRRSKLREGGRGCCAPQSTCCRASARSSPGWKRHLFLPARLTGDKLRRLHVAAAGAAAPPAAPAFSSSSSAAESPRQIGQRPPSARRRSTLMIHCAWNRWRHSSSVAIDSTACIGVRQTAQLSTTASSRSTPPPAASATAVSASSAASSAASSGLPLAHSVNVCVHHPLVSERAKRGDAGNVYGGLTDRPAHHRLGTQ